MSLRFFADHCIPSSVIRMLSNAGHDVFRLRDHTPTDSPDSAVIEKAQEIEAILISLNGDFSDIVTYPAAKYKGIIALQVRNHPEVIPDLMERLEHYLSAHDNMEHYKGKLLIAEVHRIRIRQ
jgi:predicted nuclease of predicted toxin-antitoxin system